MRLRLAGFIIGAVSLAAAQSAFAADMPAKMYTKAPVAAPAYSWSGLYIGAHGGAAWGSGGSQTLFDPNLGGFDPVTFGNSVKTSAIGGIQLGYNWQVAPAWLLGVEGDFSFTSLKNANLQAPLTTGGVVLVPISSLSMVSRVKWLSSVRGRVGYIWDTNLIYLTGGVAFANINYTSQINAFPPFASQTSFSNTKAGSVIGGGIEHMITTNWLIRAEYLHYDFGSASASAALVPVCVGCSTPLQYTWGRTKVDDVRAALSYKF